MSPSSAISSDDTTPTTFSVSGAAPEQMNGPRSVVHLGTIAANYRALCDFCSTSETGAVVKADAYGHGAAQVAAKLASEGCETFFIAYPREGEAVRDVVGPDKRIFVFHGLTNDSPELIIQHDLTPICNRVEEVKLWLETYPNRSYGLHFDTGINRLGLRLSDLEEVQKLTSGTPPILVMSHLACADQPEHAMNAQQLEKFREVVDAFPESKASLSATAASYLGPDYHFDLIRPGIALYGGGPARPPELRLKPAMSVTAPILNVFNVEAGEHTGYGATFEAKYPMTLATVSLGYADGYLRSASNYGFGMHEGGPCPIVGRVSMDLMTVDVTDLPEPPAIGSHIEFIGPKAGLEIQAEALGTIGYELTSRLGGRISREWQDED